MTPVQTLFYSGNYKPLLDTTIDSAAGSYELADAPYVIGALSFRGRLVEAELVFKLHRSRFAVLQSVIAQFFLGVGFCRISKYVEARAYFGANLKLLRAPQDPQIRFYCWQGIGFYRSFFGRYRRGFQVTQRALEAAVEANYLYGKALAADLLAHCQILPGEISSALSNFDKAIKSGKLLGDGGLVEAFAVSRAIHSAEFGLNPTEDVKNLEDLANTMSSQDNYSQSRVLVELGRQYVLRGKLNLAKQSLNKACHLIYSSNNRRLSIVLNLRFAYLAYLEGDTYGALNLVRNAVKELDPVVDRSLEFEIAGLEKRILERLGSEIEDIHRSSIGQQWTPGRRGKALHHRIILREGESEKIKLYSRYIGDDPLGDLIDECLRAPYDAVAQIVDRGYLGLLHKICPDALGQKMIVIDLEPNSMAIFDKGSVTYQRGIVTNVIRLLAQCLATGPKSKEQLIQAVWGYSYKSLQHDPLVYRSISRLRAVLEAYGDWVIPTSDGYALAPGIQIEFVKRFETAPNKAPSPNEVSSNSGVGLAQSQLNFRQLKIMELLKVNDFLDVRACVESFKVSEITARRDLSELCEMSYLVRVGKGKATKYRLRTP